MSFIFAAAPASPVSNEALSLTMDLFNELEEIYGKGRIESFTGENESFRYFVVINNIEGEAVACGALRDFSANTGEIKRMYVKPEYRGKGLSAIILKDLEVKAKALGYKRLVLETGIRQPSAVALYEKNGYTKIDCYGMYPDDPESLCYEKLL